MRGKCEKFKNIWKRSFLNKRFFFELASSFLFLILTMLIFSKFTTFIEMRKGVQLNDPFLESFTAFDFTKPIFALIYGGILWALGILLFSPFRLMVLFEAYSLMVCTRALMMFLTPLTPPSGMIFLQDPFVELFGTGKTLVNDLFFSGHTATLFLLLLSVPKRRKGYFVMITLLVAAGVILQKVHYTVDVLVAPYVSFTTYYLVYNSARKRYAHNEKET